MDVTFELWDVEAGNLISTFETEIGALTIVRELIELNGTEYADALELGRSSASGDFRLVGSGAELASLANSLELVRARHSPR